MNAHDGSGKVTRTATVDEVVASNLRRLRQEAGLTMVALAGRLSEVTGSEWTRYTIVDLEGTRSKDRPPRSARWSELVALAVALQVSIFDLVMPGPDVSHVNVARASKVERSQFPEGTMVAGRSYAGMPKTKTTTYVHWSDRDEYAALLFGLPAASLTAENITKVRDTYGVDTADALADIAETQDGLVQMIEQLDRAVARYGAEQEEL